MFNVVWDTKDCATPGCNQLVEFKWGWPHIPNYCSYCQGRFARLVPQDWEFALREGFPKIENNEFLIKFACTGTNGSDYLVSWKLNEDNAVWTDLGVSDEADPLRHRDPRPPHQHLIGRKK